MHQFETRSRSETPSSFQIGTRPTPRLIYSFTISNLGNLETRSYACLIQGMSICFLLLAAQVVVAVIAFARESGKDERFEGDKLGYRS